MPIYKKTNQRSKRERPKRVMQGNEVAKTTKQLYHEYLKSEEWKAKRPKFMERYKNKCAFCGSEDDLAIHHLHYDNVGDETVNDVVCLCKKCHNLAHRNKITILMFDTKEDYDHFIAIAEVLANNIHPLRNYLALKKVPL